MTAAHPDCAENCRRIMQSLVSTDSTWEAGSKAWRMAATGNPSAVRYDFTFASRCPNTLRP